MLTTARVTRPERAQQLGGHVWRASDGDDRLTPAPPPHLKLVLFTLAHYYQTKGSCDGAAPSGGSGGGGGFNYSKAVLAPVVRTPQIHLLLRSLLNDLL